MPTHSTNIPRLGLNTDVDNGRLDLDFDDESISRMREPNREPAKVLALTDVAPVDVLVDYGLLIVLSSASYVPPSD